MAGAASLTVGLDDRDEPLGFYASVVVGGGTVAPAWPAHLDSEELDESVTVCLLHHCLLDE